MRVDKICTSRGFEPIEFVPTDAQRERAEARVQQSKKDCLTNTGKEYPNNSITYGAGRLPSFIFEEWMAEYYPGTELNQRPPKSKNDPDCYWHNDMRNRWLFGTVECKCVRCSGKPASHFNGHVAAYNTSQKCDWYAFGRMRYDNKMGWLCGFIRPKDFYKLAVPMRTGDEDPNSQHPYQASAACFDLSYGQMIPPPRMDGSLEDIDPMFLVQEYVHELNELVCVA